MSGSRDLRTISRFNVFVDNMIPKVNMKEDIIKFFLISDKTNRTISFNVFGNLNVKHLRYCLSLYLESDHY